MGRKWMAINEDHGFWVLIRINLRPNEQKKVCFGWRSEQADATLGLLNSLGQWCWFVCLFVWNKT